jgi:hypothetical protein
MEETAILETNMAESKKAALAVVADCERTPMERRIEDERQTYDVLHIMDLQEGGKPFPTHLDDTDGLDLDETGARDIGGSPLFSPKGKLMFRYLDQMRMEARAALAKRIESLPLREALSVEGPKCYWGHYEPNLVRLVKEWHEHAQNCRRNGEPVPTPAFWLLKNRPPWVFQDSGSVVSALQSILASYLVDGQNWPFTEYGLREFKTKRAA